jgi:hypothetical protein
MHFHRYSQLLSFVVVVLAAPVAARADSFDQVLTQEHAPKLYALLDKAGYKAVGFLNFSLSRESLDKTSSFHNAPITRVLPARLQNALLLYAATKFENDLKLLADPSAVAGEKGVASYRTPADLTKLFELTFPVVAVGTPAELVKPDAFVIGDINLSADRTTTQVTLKVLDARSPEPKELYSFAVPTDLSILAESGVSFSLRSRDVKPQVRDVVLPGEVRNKVGESTSALGSAWIDFDVLYDSVPQKINRDVIDPAKYMVPGVKPGQRITFRVKNVSKVKLGVAVLVNKKNVLYGEDIETRDPRRLSKIILTAGTEQSIHGLLDVEGDGRQANIVRELRGLSDQETAAAAKELGASNYCGHITVYVFREGVEQVTSAPKTEKAATPVATTPPSNGLRNPSNRLSWVSAGSLEKLFKESDEVARARDVLIDTGAATQKIETREDRINNPEYAEAIHIRYWQPAKSNAPLTIGK